MLTPEQQLALTKFKPDSTARAALGPGEYQETFLARVTSKFKIGEDYEAKQANSIPWKDLALVLAAKLNAATREKVLRETLQALALGEGVDTSSVSEEVQALAEGLLGTTVRTCNGKLTGTTIIERVEEGVKV